MAHRACEGSVCSVCCLHGKTYMDRVFVYTGAAVKGFADIIIGEIK